MLPILTLADHFAVLRVEVELDALERVFAEPCCSEILAEADDRVFIHPIKAEDKA